MCETKVLRRVRGEVGPHSRHDVRRRHVLPSVALRCVICCLLFIILKTTSPYFLAGLHAVLPELRPGAHFMFGTIRSTQCRLPRADVQPVTLPVTFCCVLLSLGFGRRGALLGPFSNTRRLAHVSAVLLRDARWRESRPHLLTCWL